MPRFVACPRLSHRAEWNDLRLKHRGDTLIHGYGYYEKELHGRQQPFDAKLLTHHYARGLDHLGERASSFKLKEKVQAQVEKYIAKKDQAALARSSGALKHTKHTRELYDRINCTVGEGRDLEGGEEYSQRRQAIVMVWKALQEDPEAFTQMGEDVIRQALLEHLDTKLNTTTTTNTTGDGTTAGTNSNTNAGHLTDTNRTMESKGMSQSSQDKKGGETGDSGASAPSINSYSPTMAPTASPTSFSLEHAMKQFDEHLSHMRDFIKKFTGRSDWE